MSVILRADNRALTEVAVYNYTLSNLASGVTAIPCVNVEAFAANDYVLFGNFGSDTAEIRLVSTVTDATNTLTLSAATSFAHPESTKVTIIPFNKARFYWTATEVFATTTPITGYIDLAASDWYIIATDTTHSTGYGWSVFYNSTTDIVSDNSNSIPYAGFAQSSVTQVVNDFYSILNNKELRLITTADALSWLNEGYAIIRNELNLVNQEYNASSEQTISIVAGTQEYALPSDFSDLLAIWVDGTFPQYQIPFVRLADVPSYIGSMPRYYIRGAYIGFAPVPDATATYKYRYLKKATRITSLSEDVDLPDNAFFAVKDFMLYRAYQKLTSPNSSVYYTRFNDWINRLKIYSIRRDAGLDSFSVSPYANV